MARAIWNGTVIAASENCEIVEGNQYFPEAGVKREYLRQSTKTSHCPWKGDARYFDVVVDGKVNKDAAWCYAKTEEAAKHIEGHVAFWNGVTVEP